jgi:hypothetical protein
MVFVVDKVGKVSPFLHISKITPNLYLYEWAYT